MVVVWVLINLSGHAAASALQRREPRLDRGGLRLGERVVAEAQVRQRRQRPNRFRERRELVAVEVQVRQRRQRPNRFRERRELVVFEAQLLQPHQRPKWLQGQRREFVVADSQLGDISEPLGAQEALQLCLEVSYLTVDGDHDAQIWKAFV